MISLEEVKHIADLSRIDFSAQELKQLQKELFLILNYIDKLKEVDVKGIEPTNHSMLVKNVLRKDEAKEMTGEISNSIVDFTGNAVVGATGGDMILLGLLFILLISFVLLKAKVKAGNVVAIGVCITFTFSLLNPAFGFMFYVALVITALVLVNGIRKMVQGQ